jgi:signal transduction histidine kinase
LVPQTRLRLTGVCTVQDATEIAARLIPVSFTLLSRSSNDIEVVRRAPWWNTGRLVGALLLLGFAVGTALIWVWFLRRKVRQQTEFIGAKLRNEAALEERTRLARELHDSIEQSLAGIAMQMDTASAKMTNAPETASRLLDTSRQLIRRTQHELHSSVWDLRSPLLEDGSLRTALEGPRETLLGAGIETKLSMAGAPIRLPAVTENHLLRITQELASNIVKHARATSAEIKLTLRSDRISLLVADNGSGCDLNHALSAKEGHFGLVGIRERVDKLRGRLSIESIPGEGTRISVEIPNADFFESDAKPYLYSNR